MQPSQLLEQAILQHRAGAPEKAEELCRQVLAAAPDHAGARQILGNLFMDRGRYADALTEYEHVLRIDPRSINGLMQKAMALLALGRDDEALVHFDHVLGLHPRFAPAHLLRSDLLLQSGRPAEALPGYGKALALQPQLAEAWFGQGLALAALHRCAEAVACYDRAIALKPGHVQSWFHRAGALEELMRLTEALASYDRVVALDTASGIAFNNRGVVLTNLQRYDEATLSFERAMAVTETRDLALGGLVGAALRACDWEKVEALKADVRQAVEAGSSGISPGVMFGCSDDPALLQRCAANFAAGASLTKMDRLWRGEIFRNPKIRIAYLSWDFHDHATAHLIAELFERHDREKFEIWGIGFDTDDGSAWRRRLLKSFDRFIDASTMTDSAVAELIRQERVDIAVDLKGYTLGARTGIFARRPAPLQVNYLGYPGTMGVDFYDYILADRIVLPEEQAPFYNEKIAWLPDCYQPNISTRTVTPMLPSRAQVGLPDQGFVFCCFNMNWKITAPVFEVWMRLLAAVPGSILWLMEDSAVSAANLRRRAAASGIAPERLIFAPRLAVDLHLSRHRLADLFLDTLLYNAHTVASDALRLGVPLVTMTGRSFSGRVATSLLHAVGMPELAAPDLASYERIALELAQGGLAAAREKLRANLPTAPLFDAGRYCRGIEQAYRTMWEYWQAGRQPENFAVPRP